MSSGVEHDSSDDEADIDLFAAMPTLTDTDFLSDSDSEEDHCNLDLQHLSPRHTSNFLVLWTNTSRQLHGENLRQQLIRLYR
jgi:hypothetical protein